MVVCFATSFPMFKNRTFIGVSNSSHGSAFGAVIGGAVIVGWISYDKGGDLWYDGVDGKYGMSG